jgi:hypothetical protein
MSECKHGVVGLCLACNMNSLLTATIPPRYRVEPDDFQVGYWVIDTQAEQDGDRCIRGGAPTFEEAKAQCDKLNKEGKE